MRQNGQLLPRGDAGRCARLVRQGEGQGRPLPPGFVAHLQVGRRRFALTAEQVQALEAELARVQALPLGQAVAAQRAALAPTPIRAVAVNRRAPTPIAPQVRVTAAVNWARLTGEPQVLAAP
ncbi:hypothetical protein [Deinococcus multiflagellatus]|uniref:Uncharacterized protein n=1 Tax=Deinococcus multiflagellatus TaxID=1656887 RepID=A0ABW1ZRM2_9DEIO|nr:hypothetical protein [Deinococcus multiflagellatus]MBZ9715949.1 hypothetical protein [Deinococcus multiflagellatus]